MKLVAGGRRLLWLGWVGTLSVSCGSTLGGTAGGPQTLDQRIQVLGLDPAEVTEPLDLTPEMKAWAHEQVRAQDSEEQRLSDVMRALVDSDGLAVRYERERTGTAREVFKSGEANCLSFTNLLVGLAREVGVDAYFLNVRRDPRYALQGDLVVRWEHVTAGWGSGAHRRVLEFGFVPIEATMVPSRLDDITALAMFYSNRGAEELLAGNRVGALKWLEIAVQLDPAWSHAWLNLGVVRRRTGDLEGAEQAYRKGIEADPDHMQLYSNLSTLLRLRGETDSAGELLRLLDRRSNRNPFAYLALGDSALEDGRMEEARRFYRRALHLNRNDAESKAAMGLWELAAERPDRARVWLERAERIDRESERVGQLRDGLVESDPVTTAEEEAPVEPERLQRRSNR